MLPSWDAFICYRRGDGRTAARWIYRELVRFRPDPEFGPWPPLKIFLDEATEVAANNFYDTSIKPELISAGALIVVCTASSDRELENGELNWQQRELADFMSAHPERTIIPVIVDGDLDGSPLPNVLHETHRNIHRVDGRVFRRRFWRVRPMLLSALREEIVDVAGAARHVPRDRMDLLHRLDARARFRAAIAGIVLAMLIAAALAVSTTLAVRAQRAQEAELIRSLTRQGAALAATAPTSASLLFARAIELGDERDLDEPARAWLATLGDPEREVIFEHRSEVRAAIFDPAGDRLASGSRDGAIAVWGRDGRAIARMHHDKAISHLEFSKDGKRLLSAGWDGKVRVWDANTGARLMDHRHGDAVLVARFNPQDTVIASAGWNDQVHVINAATGATLAELPVSLVSSAIDFHPRGHSLLVASGDGSACVYETTSWARVHAECHRHPTGVTALHYSAQGRTYVAGGERGAVELVDAASERSIELDGSGGGTVFDVALSPASEAVIAYASGHRARVWAATTSGTRMIDLPHAGLVRDVELSRDGRAVLTASDDGTARLRLANTGRELVAPFDHLGGVNRAVFSPDDRSVLTAGADGLARLRVIAGRSTRLAQYGEDGVAIHSVVFDAEHERAFLGTTTGLIWTIALANGERVRELDVGGAIEDLAIDPHGAWLAIIRTAAPAAVLSLAEEASIPRSLGAENEHATAAAFSADGQVLIIGYADGAVGAFSPSTGAPRFARVIPPKGPSGPERSFGPKVMSLAAQSSGRYFASGHEDGGVHLWTFDGKRVDRRWEHAYLVAALAFSPDDRRLLSAGGDGLAYLWDVASSSTIAAQKLAHGEAINSATFARDGASVLTAGDDQTAALWSLGSGKERIARLRHAQAIWCAELSPDDRWIVTASQDQTGQLWDAESGEKIGAPLYQDATVTRAHFSPDGKRVITAGFDGAVLHQKPRFAGEAARLLERMERATRLTLDRETQAVRVTSSN